MRYRSRPGGLKFRLHSNTRPTKHMSAHDSTLISSLRILSKKSTHTTGSIMTARQMLQLAKSFKDASVYATAQVFKKGIAVRSISFDSDIPMLNHHFSSQLVPVASKGCRASCLRAASASLFRSCASYFLNTPEMLPRSNSAQ